MRYLIDTQILIWAIIDPTKLSDFTKSILQQNEIVVSQISLFEVVIKQKLNKIPQLSIPVAELIDRLEKDNFEILEIKNQHIEKYYDIPLVPEHRDPFDRLILATALHENIPLISADEKFKHYQELIHLVEN